MAITKSAKKALRQSKRRAKVNLRQKKALKSLIKEVKALISQNKKEKAKELLPKVYKYLDKAVKTGLIKENTSARNKSRITQNINKAAKTE